MARVLRLPDPIVLTLVDLEIDEASQMITALAQTTSPEAPCPVCGQEACRVQSRYVRTLADLPCCGQQVRWLVQVRRFWCENRTCPRKIFTERLPSCAPAYARRTIREKELLYELAFALGGRAGEPIVHLLGMPVSHDTLIRLMRRQAPPACSTPRVLGVDDFSFKRGRKFGTILVDLILHKVVDVLPDREAETLVKWLREHTGIEIVSRDRAGSYADAVRRGAPGALQVSDRFHLLVNLQTTLVRYFERTHERLASLALQERLRQKKEVGVPADETRPPVQLEPKPSTRTERHRQARRAKRQNRYEEVIKLHEQGASQVAIAHLVGLDRDTVRRYIRAPGFPEIVRPGRRHSKLDPYKDYLQQRVQEGQRNATHLIEELRARGYQGGGTIVRDYLRNLCPQPEWHTAYQQIKQEMQSGTVQAPLSAREAAWLFVCNPRKLKLEQVLQLEPLRVGDEEFASMYELAQDFRMMVVAHQAEYLPRWLEEAKASGIAELKGFVAGISRDYDAVRNGLSLEWSQGQTEAQVHRLKLIKRQGYGRANFDLLRLRILHRAPVPNQQKCV
jgi:transposase